MTALVAARVADDAIKLLIAEHYPSGVNHAVGADIGIRTDDAYPRVYRKNRINRQRAQQKFSRNKTAGKVTSKKVTNCLKGEFNNGGGAAYNGGVMAGNSFGSAFRVSSFGESHGAAIGCIIDGCPPRLPLSEKDIQPDLNRRKPGASKFVTQRRESDTVEILSGVFEGQTTGAPIALLIRNHDAKPKDYAAIRHLFRPGHADYTYHKKYGIRDHRGGGRSSARETAARVAAGAVAKKALRSLHKNARIRGCLRALGGVHIPFVRWSETEKNPFFSPNAAVIPQLEAAITALRKEGDSCGALIEVVASGIPAGLGEPVFDRLDADIARALMSINAVKGVEIGDGFAVAHKRGSENNDEMTANKFATNHAGGILGGISTGAPIIARLAVKPTSSIRRPQRTRDTKGKTAVIATTGRHDPCVGIRAVPIAEAMLALTLADHALRWRGQCR